MPFLKAKNVVNTTSLVNSYISNLCESIDTPVLGPLYSLEDDSQTVEKWLANYRIKRYFQVPNGTNDIIDSSVMKMFDYDRNGLTHFCPATDKNLLPHVRSILYRARAECHRILKNYRFRPVKHFKCPTGESFIAAKGDTSVFAKLKVLMNWTCTADAFDQVAETIYNVRWLKRIAKKHIGYVSPRENQQLAFACDYDGFEIFKNLLLDIITIVDGSAISYVDKDNESKRVITREPFLNMVNQLIISGSLKDCMKKGWAYDKETAQGVHGCMISDLNYATFDLSNASNSNWLVVMQWLFPERLCSDLLKNRSSKGRWKGSWHEFAMLSPMGNGFTFEVMTIILMAVVKSIDFQGSVYGDDIIIHAEHSQDLLDTLQYLGYELNQKKSFGSGLFRESCGAFYHKNRYLRSYKMEYATDIMEAVINVNKLLILREVLGINDSLRSLIKSIPLALLREGDLSGRDKADLSEVICVPSTFLNVKRLKKECSDWTRKVPTYKQQMKKFIRDYTYDHRKVDFYISLSKSSLTYLDVGKWKHLPINQVRDKTVIGYYLYSGMCTAPTIRNKTRIKERLVVY